MADQFNRIDTAVGALPFKNTSWAQDMLGSDGRVLVSQKLPVFMCGSDSTEDLNMTYTNDPAVGTGRSNYVGCLGDISVVFRRDPAFRSQWGVFGRNTKVKFGDISDGSSNTILIGERSSKPETGPDARTTQGAIWIGSMFRNNSWKHNNPTSMPNRFSNVGQSSGDIYYVVNGDYRGRNICSSEHPGGASAGFADGSSHFLSDNIANQILRDLCKMSDGNVIGAF